MNTTNMNATQKSAALERVSAYLAGLQERICAGLESHEPESARFEREEFSDERVHARSRVLLGATFERAVVHTTRARANQISPAVLARRPELAGRGFEALSLSTVVHPRNPHVPTAHANLRLFLTTAPGGAGDTLSTAPDRRNASAGDAVFWFGGGFDLTPCYGYPVDARHWHRTASDACRPFGDALYPQFKSACDDYFYLPHRHETRGVGGIFFDDLDTVGDGSVGDRTAGQPDVSPFERCFDFVRSVGDHFLVAYLPIVERRCNQPYGDRERSFQKFRRGRYVEFNLLYDRGTRYGLKMGRRTEAVLSSLPPSAEWRYEWRAEKESAEERLRDFLEPRDWLSQDPSGTED